MRSFFLLTGSVHPRGHSDDQTLFSRMSREGRVEWLNWKDPQALKAAQDELVRTRGLAPTCLIRTPWDYQDDSAAFVKFLRDLESAGIKLWNPLQTVLWNLDKSYLLELQELGIATVPTVSGENFVSDSDRSGRCVLKPRVGAGGKGVRLLSALEARDVLTAESAREKYLVQDFMTSVETEGESSLIFYRIGRKPVFSHAVRKRPVRGEFRCQSDFGGNETPEFPETGVLNWAEEILSYLEQALGYPWLYARVDVLYQDGRPLLGELELIEPQLFHRYGTSSVDLLVRSVLEHS